MFSIFITPKMLFENKNKKLLFLKHHYNIETHYFYTFVDTDQEDPVYISAK